MSDKPTEVSSITQHASSVLHDGHASDKSTELAPKQPEKVAASSEGLYRDFNCEEASAEPLLERWILYKTYDWKQNDNFDSELFSIDMPFDFIKENKSSPTAIMFLSNMYYRGDIEVKVQVNSNKFMVGLLQISYYYCADLDEQYLDSRNSVWVRSQLPGGYISAGASNSLEITVPFCYPKAYVTTRDSNLAPNPLNIFQLKGKVLSALKATSTAFTVARVSVFFSFKKSQFTGLIDMSITNNVNPQPQMFGMGLKAAEHLLHEINSDNNRDLPPYTRSGQVMIPKSNTSMACGKNDIVAICPLRLDNAGQTPSALGRMSTKIQKIATKKGLLTSFIWNVDDDTGALLFSIPVMPLMSPQYYKIIKSDNTNVKILDTYAIPPIGVVSSMFAYWRGIIKYSLKFVASQFHTGRVLISFTPYQKYNLTINEAKNSYFAIFDLQEDCDLEFNCPFIFDNPWASTFDADVVISKSSFPIGQFSIFVLNKLTPMDQVPSRIEVFIWMSAGDTFQVAVPISPVVGLGWDRMTLDTSADEVIAKDGYSNVYMGSWHYLNGGQSYILRYGNVSEHVAQVLNAQYGVLYSPNDSKHSIAYYLKDKDSDKVYTLQSHLFLCPFIPNDTARYLCPVSNLSNAKNYFKTKDPKYLIQYYRDFPDYIETKYWKFVPVYRSTEPQVVVASPGGITRHIDPTMCFGESFDDLKDFMRRYQPYLSENITLNATYNHNQVCLRIPIIPGGLPLTLNNDKTFNNNFNKSRHGHIPIVLSCARFFTGSIRLKIVFSAPFALTPFVQHIPSSILLASTEMRPSGSYNDSYFGHSFASLVQPTAINPVIEIEIPFYQPGTYGILQRPKLSQTEKSVRIPKDIERLFNLGYLNVGFLNSFLVNEPIEVEVYYAIGDDFVPYVFQGFPPMTFNSKVPLIVPSLRSFKFQERPIMEEIKSDDFEPLEEGPLPQMLSLGWAGGKKICNAVRKTEKLARVVTVPFKINAALKEILPEHQGEFGDVHTLLASVVSSIFPDMSVSKTSIIHSAISQLVHVLINPTKATIAWAIASFLSNVGLICASYMSSIVAFYTKFLSIFEDVNNDDTNASHQDNVFEVKRIKFSELFDDSELNSFASVCIAGLTTALGMTISVPKTGFKNYIGWLLKGITTFTLSFKVILEVIKNSIGMFKKFMLWITIDKDNSVVWEELAQTDGKEMSDWASRVNLLTNPLYKDKIEADVFLQKEVFDLYTVGQLYAAKLIKSKTNGQINNYIRLFQDKISRLYSALVEKHLSPPIKFEPIVIQFSGAPGIGKSYLQQDFCVELLKHVNYTTYNPPIYCKTPGNKFFNALSNQPCFLFDDFLNLTTPAVMEEHLIELFCLKSRSVYNPPMAELENKNVKYSPLIVLIASNKSYWEIPSVSCMDAVHRRRDIIWFTRVRNEFKDRSVISLTEHERTTYAHLEFALQPSIPDANYSQDNLTFMPYSEMLAKSKSMWAIYYENELRNFRHHLAQVNALYPEDILCDAKELLATQEERVKTLNKRLFHDRMQDAPKWRQRILNQSIPESFHQGYEEDLAAMRAELPALETNAIVINSGEVAKIPAHLIDASHCTSRELYYWKVDILKDNGDLKKQLDVKDLTKAYCYSFRKLWEVMNSTPNLIEGIDHSVCGKYLDCKHRFMDENFIYNSETKAYDNILPADILTPRSIPYLACTVKEGCLKRDFILNSLYTGTLYELNLQLLKGKVVTKDMAAHLAPDFLAKFLDNPINIVVQSSVDLIDETIPVILPLPPQQKKETFWEKVYSENSWIWKLLSQLGKLVAGVVAIFGVSKLFFKRQAKKVSERVFPKAPQSTAPSISFVENEPGTTRISSQANKPFAQQSMSADPGTHGKPKKTIQDKVKESYKRLVSDGADFQGGQFLSEPGNLELIVQGNTFLLECKVGSIVIRGRGLGVFQRFGIFLKHTVQGFNKLLLNEEEPTVRMYINGKTIDIHWHSIRNFTSLDSSLAILELPKIVASFRDIRKHVASTESVDSIDTKGIIVEANESHCKSRNVYIKQHFDLQISPTDFADGQKLSVVYEYEYGGAGVCGSVLISAGHPHKIVGIHVAGYSNGRGYAEPIWRELLDHFYHPKVPRRVEPQDVFLHNPRYEVNAKVRRVGGVPPQLARIPSKNSHIVPSKLSGTFPPRTCPAPLFGRDPRIGERDVLAEGLQKRNGIPTPFKAEDIARAVKLLSRHFISTSPPLAATQQATLSINDVIEGNPNIPEYKGINMRTSEGFPWYYSRPAGSSNKSWMFELSENERGVRTVGRIDDMLLWVLSNKQKQRERNIIPFTVFTDSLKDCRIKHEKLHALAPTRIFSVSPVDYTIQYKQYFDHFHAATTRSRVTNFLSIGINADGNEWGELYRFTTSMGKGCVSGDYSAFGDTLANDCIDAAFQIINNWYSYHFNEDSSHINQQVRRLLGKEVTEAYYLCVDSLYRPYCGIPSGFPGTVYINSLVNLIYICIGYFKVTTDSGFDTERYFFSHLKINVYGDDFIIGVHDEIIPYFDGKRFSNFLGSFGICLHSANKSGAMEAIQDISECTYLKRGFVRHPQRVGQVLAPLPTHVVEEVCQWVWTTSPDIEGSIFFLARATLECAYGKGEAYYSCVLKTLEARFAQLGLRLDSDIWSDIDRRIYNPDLPSNSSIRKSLLFLEKKILCQID